MDGFKKENELMSIPKFVGHMNSNPLLIPNRYNINITSPVGTFGQEISMNCIAVSVPSRSIATSDRYLYGPTTKVPYVEIFDDLAMTFRLSADMYERGLVDSWMDKIGGQQYGAAYFDDIKGTAQVSILHRNNATMKTYNFFDVIPINISESSFSQDAEEPSTVTVQFAYHHYEWS